MSSTVAAGCDVDQDRSCTTDPPDTLRAAVADGGGRWVAYAPLSGRTFDPGTDGSTS